MSEKSDDWAEYKLLILDSLQRIEKNQQHLSSTLQKVNIELTKVSTKNGIIYGALSGGILGALISGMKMIVEFFHRA